MPSPIDPETRAAVLADIKAGLKSRNSIAREHGVSTTTVSKIARVEHIEQPFSREQTKNATEAAVADAAASRVLLSKRFLAEAHNALDALHQPHTAFNFGGKDNTYNSKALPEPPTGDKRNLMIIAATAADKHMQLDRHDSDTTGLAAVDSWLLFMSGKPPEPAP
jgi:transposase-like protein